MTRKTSIAAYNKIVEDGLLSKLRLFVYEIVYKHGPLTANEMRLYASKNANSGVFSTRLSELQRMGAVETVGERACKTTGHTAMLWDVTGRLPTKLVKDIPRREKRDEILKDLKDIYQLAPFELKERIGDVYKKVKAI